MNDLPFHFLLFSITGAVIVIVSAMFSENSDAAAWRVVPKRLLYFFFGCSIVAAVMLVLEHTLASAT
jgi:hypothetical protein